MQNLRDKLLKAGKISKRDKRRADQESRQKRKKRGGHVEAAEAEAKRQEAYERKRSEERERNLALAEAQRAERELKEERLRVAHIVDFYGIRVREGGHRWHFMARDKKVLSIDITGDLAWQMSQGGAAIVERPDLDGHVERYTVVPRDPADLVWDISDAYVRFYNRGEDRPARWWEEEAP